MILNNNINQSVYAFVFARGGSKGVPGKNIRNLAGKPLIAYAIECAFASSYVDKVIVSTDDPDIAAVATRCGAEVPFMRPSELAGDDSAEWLAWRHAVGFLKEQDDIPNVFLSVPATAPMRAPCDLDACVEKFVREKFDIIITASDAARNPCFNMVKLGSEGEVELALVPETPIVRRQDAPCFFDIATVGYATSPDFILRNQGLFDGRVGMVVVPRERALDIDTMLDFKIADFLMREKQHGVSDEES